MRSERIEYRHLRESDKEDLKKQLIYRAQPVSDSYTSIPIKHTLKDTFKEHLSEILGKVIEHIICKPGEIIELLEYLKPTIEQLLERHNSNKQHSK